MNLTWLDWTLVTVIITFIVYVTISTKKLTRTVADFLAANRCAGRYLLTIATGEATLGAVIVVAGWEVFYKSGFAPTFWGAVTIPISLIMTLSGWVIYRYRQTRAMTMAQFFEMRYSRKFRIYAGILAYVSGIINFGVFPGVGARFFINFCGFPVNFEFLGITWATYPVLMAFLIGLALYFTFTGGQIAVMVTDFWQGLIAIFVVTIITAFLWVKFPWNLMCEGLVLASEEGKSLINPFDIGSQKDFNLSYYLITWFFYYYGFMAWQGNQGYNCSASTAHEAKMAGVITKFRVAIIALGMILIPLAAVTVMHHPNYVDVSKQVTTSLQESYPNSAQTQMSMTVPIVISCFLPIGLLGALVAAMLGFFISTHNTYLHSWGSIFIQDVYCPLSKKTLSNEQHLKYLRISIIFVAVFIFFFSWIFPLEDYIYMFFNITGAIYLGGAGAVIIGGLYWKRGTAAGAWVAMTVGCVLSFTSITVQQVWPHAPNIISRLYNLSEGQNIQLKGQVLIDNDWPSWEKGKLGDKSDTKPDWYSLSEGQTFVMEDFSVGQKANDPLPEDEYKILEDGRKIAIGAKASTIEQIRLNSTEANLFWIKGKIVKKLGKAFFVVSDQTDTMVAQIKPAFPVNGTVASFWCAACAIASYIIVSLITCKGKKVDMDRLLHRGIYAIKEEEGEIRSRVKDEKPVVFFWRLIGVNSHEFSKMDKVLFLYSVLYAIWGLGSFLFLVYLAMTGQMNEQRWLIWWRIVIFVMFGMAVVGLVWISIGGLLDLKKMYYKLRTVKRDELDDGRVESDYKDTSIDDN